MSRFENEAFHKSNSTLVPGFLSKTFEIFNSEEYNKCCGFGPRGDTIVIKKIDEFSKVVLPTYFKHANYQSFVRQLNMYDFRKTVQDPSISEFQHQFFLKDRPDLLPLIKRKASVRSSATIASKALVPIESTTECVLSEMEEQQAMRKEIDNKIQLLEVVNSQVIQENQYLRSKIIESNQKQAIMQERMENIFRVMYMYMNSGDVMSSGIPQLLNSKSTRKQNMLLMGAQANNVVGSIDTSIVPPYDISGGNVPVIEDLGVGLQLSKMNSFDGSFLEPGLGLTRTPSFDGSNQQSFGLSFDSFKSEILKSNNIPGGDSLPGIGLKRLASLNSSQYADSVQVAHYTSDRVTEVESVSQQKMTKSSSQIIDNIDAIVPSTSVDDPAEYIDKLNKSQETTLTRLDSLELTLAELLDSYDNLEDIPIEGIDNEAKES